MRIFFLNAAAAWYTHPQCGDATTAKANNLDNTECAITDILKNQPGCSVKLGAPCIVPDGKSIALNPDEKRRVRPLAS